MLSTVVKNTFLEIEEPEFYEGGKRRSQSVPRSWKLQSPSCAGGKSDSSDTASTADDTPSLHGESSSDQDSPGSDASFRGRRAQERSDGHKRARSAHSAGFKFQQAASSTDDDENEDAQSFKSCNDGEDSSFGEEKEPTIGEDELVYYQNLVDPSPLHYSGQEVSYFGDEEPSGTQTPVMPWASTPSPPSTPTIAFTRRSPPLLTYQALEKAAAASEIAPSSPGQTEGSILAATSLEWPPKLSGLSLENPPAELAAPEIVPEAAPENAVCTPSCPTKSELVQEKADTSLDALKRAAMRRLPQLPKTTAGTQRRLNALDLDLRLAAPLANRLTETKAAKLVATESASRGRPLRRRPLAPGRVVRRPAVASPNSDDDLPRSSSPSSSRHSDCEASGPHKAQAEKTQSEEGDYCQSCGGLTPTTRWADEVEDCMYDTGVPELSTTNYGIEPPSAIIELPAAKEENAKAKVTLDLCLALPTVEQVRTPLKRLASESVPFTPIMNQMTEAMDVIAAARLALLSAPGVMWAEMQEGTCTPGCSTTVMAEVTPAGSMAEMQAVYVEALNAAKAALLEAAAASTCVYIMGYCADPFKDLGEESGVRAGFVAQIGLVPASEEKKACWDTYQMGYCTRRATCRWCHPSDADLVTVVVNLL